MTVEEFTQRLEGLGQRATDLSDILTQIGTEITTAVRANAPEDTGALKRSIQFSVTPDSLSLEMLNYGVFQNYGVDGTKTASAKEIEPGIFGITQKRFKFKSLTIGGSLPFPVRRSIAERGLKPKSFFSIADLKEEVATRIEEEITQPFN